MVPQLLREDCDYYVSLWITFWTFTLVLNTAIIFCRFVYVELATGIIIEGQLLLNITIVVISLMMAILWIILWPFIRILFVESSPQYSQSMKVKICIHENMTEHIREGNRKMNFKFHLALILS